MTKRLLLSYLTITLIVLLLLEIPLGLFFAQRERERLTADVERDANVIATLYEDDLESGRPLDPQPAETYEERTGARVVVVDSSGISQVDTDQPVNRDFSTRPEIAIALEGARSSGSRTSETLGIDLLFVAVPVASGGTVHGALRITLDASDVTERIRQFWFALAGIGVIVLASVAVIGWVIARSVTRPVRQLNAAASRFARGDLTVTDETLDGPPELRALGDTMVTMAYQLDGLIGTQRAFVADASHQLRTPLTALRLRLENLATRLPPDDTRSSIELEAAIDETNRLAELVTNLLRLARADEHPRIDIADLTTLTGDRIDTWTAVAEARGVTLIGPRADAHPRGVLVESVPGAIEQILDNLLDNALGVSDAGSTVRAEIETTDEVATLTISDEGPGLSDDDKALATRRFWRRDVSTPGTGLGLAIVDALSAAAGGRVVLDDAPGGGLAVRVEFRIADESSS